MEKFSDIYQNIKERLSNPLIFSFCFSWLITNWKVTTSLFWYDGKQFEKDGYGAKFFDVLEKEINVNNALLIPLAVAVAYTVLLPFIKNLIKALYSWCLKWGENWNLKIMAGGSISVSKYLSFRSEYDKRTKLLQEVISKESEN